MTTPTLDEMEARAQRQLDGMTVNRNALANDVLLLVRTIREAQKRALERSTVVVASAPVFDTDLFGGIFRKKG